MASSRSETQPALGEAELEPRPREQAQQPNEQRAEALIERALSGQAPRRRMLVLANPYATTVSSRLKNLVVYALQSRYAVEAVETEAPGHATELCREAASEGYDLVAAFGGDGTINEAANGLAGSRTALAVLPGGSTNVFCRTIGVPNDVVDAAEHLLGLADRFEPRLIDTGLANGRHFVFSSGVGLDADVVARVESRPELKARLREHYFTYAAFATFGRSYLARPARVRVEVDGRVLEGITALVQNSDPFTYFGGRPIRVCEGAGLDTGRLSLTVLRRAGLLDLATLAPRVFSGRAAWVARHRHIDAVQALTQARVSALGGGALPLQVDGDYLGEVDEVRYESAPRSLAIVV